MHQVVSVHFTSFYRQGVKRGLNKGGAYWEKEGWAGYIYPSCNSIFIFSGLNNMSHVLQEGQKQPINQFHIRLSVSRLWNQPPQENDS